ncbi:putative quinol monooxygenase [Georgenia thermotolerans]|uniref:Antibiotic biosynthesis monooxygenase n=1 Tax=Georgenia thermotolerans TaxID=527326 RepID=A0A7J5ULV8_9MICO|nr:antibiotic biosynthesis monooxygenase [Georgenia thermotolerans]KAE8763358.1 antibiotic biosynthesis monooxygenase [Georgenia thermotolerans]
MTYGLFTGFTAHPGRGAELLDVLLAAAEALRADPACLHYVAGTAEDDPDAVWVWEAWIDRAAHDAALEPPEVRAAIARARPLLAGTAGRTAVRLHAGKGLPGGG